MKKIIAIVASLTLTSAMLAPFAHAQSGRDTISIVGSSTVYPFTTTVAEQFGRQGKFKTPKVESTGTGGGVKLFCNGVGPQYPDIANASRRMKAAEFEICKQNGVKDIVEIKIGYDGITMSEGKGSTLKGVTRKQVYLALAKQVPDPSNPQTLINNPYKTWRDVDSSLPNIKIEVLGPPPTSGTRDSFAELYMEVGCQTYPWIKAMKDLDEKRYKRICQTIREDGAYVEAGENDNLIVQKLTANAGSLGIFGYSYLEENHDRIKGLTIDGVEPTSENIASGKYTVSRPLFIYVKKAHIGSIPGLKEFIDEYVSDKALSTEGYLSDRGLVPLDKSELAKVRANAKALKNFAP
jgi:phosphate transport system substrate-binding protein